MPDDNRTGIPRFMTTAEVARAFRVDSVTVISWVRAGKLPARTLKTPGGRLLYREDDILAVLNGSQQ